MHNKKTKASEKYTKRVSVFFARSGSEFLDVIRDKSLQSFPPCYSPSPPLEQKWVETGLYCKHGITKPQVRKLSRLLPQQIVCSWILASEIELLKHLFNQRIESFAPCYSQLLLLADFKKTILFSGFKQCLQKIRETSKLESLYD